MQAHRVLVSTCGQKSERTSQTDKALFFPSDCTGAGLGFGVGDSALQWFASYLRGRRQRVVTRTSRGELYEAHRGVPQGSTLGPVLFNLSVRKLPSAASSSMVRQYADDVALYLAGRNLQQTTEELARDVCHIRDFLSERGLQSTSLITTADITTIRE